MLLITMFFCRNQKSKKKIKLLGVENVWNDHKGLSGFIELAKVLPSKYVITLIGYRIHKLKHYHVISEEYPELILLMN